MASTHKYLLAKCLASTCPVRASTFSLPLITMASNIHSHMYHIPMETKQNILQNTAISLWKPNNHAMI